MTALPKFLPGTGRGTSAAGGGGPPLRDAGPLRQRYALPPPRTGEELA